MERPKEIVIIDASVVAKWFVEEEYSAQALSIREDYRKGRLDLASTQLLPFEVLNALRYNPEFGVDDLKIVARSLEKSRIVLYPLLNELAELSIENATKYGLTIYDSSYLSLGELLGRKVYTADKRLREKARKSTSIQHLSEYS
ncbi:MAG: type II toxin-antitoxin system VapC family toxin [Nitrososphaerales archaeon]